MDIICSLFGGTYTDLWQAVIRPGRDDYKIEELGPFRFEIFGKCYKRIDFELLNKRGYKLQCSFWEPFDEEREYEKLPCVIYLHGNSSSRCEAFSEVKYLLPKNITLFSFDFCGCGKSEGNYISLGYYEKDDVDCVVEYLKKSKKVSKIALWGRSMGAVTAIMYAAKKQNEISAMILDSGFYSLKILINELVEMKINLPQFIINNMLNIVKGTVKEKANFNLDEIEPYIYSKKCNVPAFFCHGIDDNFVKPHHCQDLFNSYLCNDKILNFVEGGHNTPRSKNLKEDAVNFLIKRVFDYSDELDKTTIKNSYTYNNKRNKSSNDKSRQNNILTKFMIYMNSKLKENNNLRQIFYKQNIKTFSNKELLIINKNNNNYCTNKNKHKLNKNPSGNFNSLSLNSFNKNKLSYFDEDFSNVGDEMQDDTFKVEYKRGFGKIRPVSLKNKIRIYKNFTEINKVDDNKSDNNYKIFKKQHINNITELLKVQSKPSMIKIIGGGKNDTELASTKGKYFSSTFYTDKKQNIKYVIKNAMTNRAKKNDKKMEKRFKNFCASKNEIKNKEVKIKVNLNKNKKNSFLDGINPTPLQNHIKINQVMKKNIITIKEESNNEYVTNTQDTIIDESEELIGKKLPNQ